MSLSSPEMQACAQCLVQGRTEKLEGFGEEEFGGEVLFLKVRVEDYGEVEDKDAAKGGGADLVGSAGDEAVVAEGTRWRSWSVEVGVETDIEFAGDFTLRDEGAAEEAAAVSRVPHAKNTGKVYGSATEVALTG